MNDNLVDITDEYRKPKIDTDGFVDITDQYLADSKPKAAVAAGGDGLVDITNEYLSHDFPKQPSPQATRKGIIEPLPADMEAYKKAYEAGDEITYQPKPLDLTPSPNKNLAGVYAGQPPTNIPALTLKGIKDVGVAAVKNTIGAGEVAANVLTGIPGFFVDAGIATGAGYGTLLRGGSIDEAAKNITGMQDLVRPYVVYQPKTEAAKEAGNNLNKALDFLIGTPAEIAGENVRKGVEAVAGSTSGAAAGAGIKTLTELAAYTVLFSGFTEGVKRLGGIKEPIKTRPLTDKDVIDFNNFIQEEAARLKGKNLNTDDILEALRGREASQAAYDYIKILPTEERADLARSILKGKKPQVDSQVEPVSVNKGGQLPVGGLEVKEAEPVKTPPSPKVEANPQQVTLTPVTEPAFDITTSAGKMPVSLERFDLKTMADTVAEPERFDISMPAGEQAVDEGFDITTRADTVTEMAEQGKLGDVDLEVGKGDNKLIEEIGSLYERTAASAEIKQLDRIRLGQVSEKNIEDVKKATGIDLTGYERVIDNYAIKHALKEHGDVKAETARGQIALSKEDFQRIPDIVENPDKVESGGKSSLGLDIIRYIKKYNGTNYHIEEIRKGKRHAALLTMYKTKAGAASDAPLQFPAKSPSKASETFPPAFDFNIPPSSKPVKGEGGNSGFTPDTEFRREATSETEVTEPQKRSDIVNFLQEKLGLPLKVGRFSGGNKGVLGIFKIKPEVIRTKLANDIETISHEVGHALEKYLWPETLDKKGNLTGTAFQDFAGELNAIASQPRKGQPTEPEGFAEFIRLYVTDEAKAIEKAPNFYNHFERVLQTKAPEVREILHQARADFNRWVNQPSMARVLGQISIGENKKPARDVDTLLKEAYTAIVDDLFPLRKIVKEMTGKEELPAAKDPYKLARLLRGWWGKAEAFLEYKTFDYNTYEWKGKSLKAILEPVKDNLDEFRAYIVSKRALELQARGIESGILPKDANKIVSDFDKKYSGTLNELIEYQDSLLRYLRDSGVIVPRDFARMKQANRDYVPFYRVFEGETAKGAGKGMEAQDPIKRMKGSWRDIVDPLESIVKNTYLFINVAERNSVGRALVDLANSKEGMGKFVEKIPTPMRSVKVGVDEVLGKWAEKIDDPHIKEMLKDMNLSDETVSIFRPSAFVPKENVISVWEKGKRNLYEVDPDIARAFQALDKESMNSIVRLLSYPASWLRAGATLTPEFIARNPIRDQFSAFVYSKYGYVPIWDLTKGIFAVAKGNDIYWQWKKSGGEHSMLVSLDREYLQKNFEKVMQSKMEGLKDVIKNPIEALRIVSELGEAATRVGEFERGVKKEGMTKQGMQEAGFASREVTLDFARIGAKTKAVNAIIAFWNAQIQDTDRMIRAFKDRPWQTSFKVMAAITFPSVILAIVNHDDERWKEIPQWQKDNFWIIMTKNHIYRIPKPFGLGTIFGTVPERMVDHILNKNPRAFDGLLKTLHNGAAPGIYPTGAIPLIEGWANKSFFTDRPIVPRSKEGLPAEYQYQPYTTEAAKKLGEVLARITGEDSSVASPAMIENAIRGLSGGLGNHILKLADMALRKSGVLPDRIQPTKTLSDIPFIKAFAVRYPANDAESIQRFYDDYSKSKQTLAAAKELIREGEEEKSKALLSSREIVRLDNIEKALQKSHKLIDLIYYNQTMTSDEKRQLIDKTYLNMIEIAKSGNEIMDAAVNE